MRLNVLLLVVFLLSLMFFVTQCSPPSEPVVTQQPVVPTQDVEQSPPAAIPAEPSVPQTPATQEAAPQATTEALPAQETVNVQQLAEERCSTCHSFDRVKVKKDAESWAATVKRMVKKGAQLSETEQELVIKYLSETYPK